MCWLNSRYCRWMPKDDVGSEIVDPVRYALFPCMWSACKDALRHSLSHLELGKRLVSCSRMQL